MENDVIKPIPISDMARRLRVPVSWLRDECEAGRLPHLRAGKQILVDPPTIERTLRDRAAVEVSQ